MSILMNKSKIAAGGIAALMAATPAVAFASQSGNASARAASATANWQIPLTAGTAYRTANGSAQYQSQPGQRDLQIEVQRIRSLAGSTVIFSAAGKTLGRAKVSALGQADISRNTELRQAVPSIARGSRVIVRTTGGKVIVFGRF
jgi:hypothetical protein